MNILSIFEETVKKSPNKIAVSYKNDSITFLNLKKEAMRYAHIIKEIGINKPVGVLIDRNILPIIQFFGILYAHNFYVPIDSELPIDKINMIIDDAKLEIIVGSELKKDLIDKLQFNGKYITKNSIYEEMYQDISADICDPAYMIYTSGSTGKPKGVLKNHGSIASFIDAFVDTFCFKNDEIIGNQTPFYFDAAAKDIFLMVKVGATIEIIPTELFSTTTNLIEYLNEKRISFCSWVPTAISLVAQLCPFELVKPLFLKKLFFVGEVMPMKQLNKWRLYLPNIEYVNLYGQSEIAGICCYYKVEKLFEDSSILPIGKPLKNCSIYLLDGNEIITEPGHIGELYIVSNALAMGYFNDQIKTSETFLVKDFGFGETRCFKTGDLAQLDNEGNYVFSSRSDFQIKHMGRRIELGEIEAIAGSMNEIDRCCCLYDNEKKKIVLFCQLVFGVFATEIELRIKLKKIITNYMLPNIIVIMDELPLNANGKIDRQKLKKELQINNKERTRL